VCEILALKESNRVIPLCLYLGNFDKSFEPKLRNQVIRPSKLNKDSIKPSKEDHEKYLIS
jgi:hypothetical protein